MTRASDFPALREFFGGYMHEDFVRAHQSAAGALKAFEADAGATELKRFRGEAAKLLARVEDVDLDGARALLADLGARWTPRTRAALITWLRSAAGSRRD